MMSTAFVAPVIPGKAGQLDDLVRDLQSHPDENAATRGRAGITREALFLQRTPVGAQLIGYREWVRGSGQPPELMSGLTAITGIDGADRPTPVERLLRELPPKAKGELYAFAAPLAPGKTDRLREFAGELTGIHAQEYAESLRRLGIGISLFLQRTAGGDLVINILEGLEPDTAFGRMAMSEHPFERWHVQQIVDLHEMDLSQPPPPPTERLWSWAVTPAASRSR